VIITKARVKDLCANSLRIAEFRKLLAPSYDDARPVLDRELENNTDAYLFLDDAGLVEAFFMVGWAKPARISSMPAVYLGLSACQQQRKGHGLTIRLYREFIRDAAAWEAAHSQRLLLWATTAHPLILAVFHRFFEVLAPRSDGRCPEEVSKLAWELREQLGGRYLVGDDPLVLRGIATATRYSNEELARSEDARSQLDRDLFREWEIDEQQGDRLLLLGHIRTTEAGRSMRWKASGC
jgi:hypothetical protein